jgi:hypothetical protein
MAQETRAQLYAKILANLPDNTTEQITPATDRAVENAEVESCYNLLDDEATDVNYNPTTGTDWVNPDPTEVGGALDDLAGRVTTIEYTSRMESRRSTNRSKRRFRYISS